MSTYDRYMLYDSHLGQALRVTVEKCRVHPYPPPFVEHHRSMARWTNEVLVKWSASTSVRFTEVTHLIDHGDEMDLEEIFEVIASAAMYLRVGGEDIVTTYKHAQQLHKEYLSK